MRKNKGFTLIELLVVIAIIGILSSVVLASLNSARAKGSNATIISNLSNMMAEAANWYDSNGNSYGTLCGDPVIANATSSIMRSGNASATTCIASSTGTTFGLAASFTQPDTSLPGGLQGFYCVDSNGYSGGVASLAYLNANAVCK